MVIVHDSSVPKWEFGFSPLRYAYGASLDQYLAEWRPDGTMELRRLPDKKVIEDPSAIRATHLALIHVDDIGAEGVVHFLRTNEPPKLSDGRLVHALAEQGWATTRTETLVAMGAAQVDWMARTPP